MQASLNANHGRWVLCCKNELFGLMVSHWWPSNPVLTQSRWLLPYRLAYHLSTLTAVIQSSFKQKDSKVCRKAYCSDNLSVFSGMLLYLLYRRCLFLYCNVQATAPRECAVIFIHVDKAPNHLVCFGWLIHHVFLSGRQTVKSRDGNLQVIVDKLKFCH